MSTREANQRDVFVVHGRDLGLRDDLFGVLRALHLSPIEWTQAVTLGSSGAPYIGEILDLAFERAQAVVVLLSPDEWAFLIHSLCDTNEVHAYGTPQRQPRPNVLFEAGMAFGRNPNRTILLQVGGQRSFSDIGGRHVIRITDAPEWRVDLVNRLEAAGCPVDRSGSDWLRIGAFAPSPSGEDPISFLEKMVREQLAELSELHERSRFVSSSNDWNDVGGMRGGLMGESSTLFLKPHSANQLQAIACRVDHEDERYHFEFWAKEEVAASNGAYYFDWPSSFHPPSDTYKEGYYVATWFALDEKTGTRSLPPKDLSLREIAKVRFYCSGIITVG